MSHEVGKSQKQAQMFCLGCDKFFKIEEEKTIAAVLKKSVQSLDKKENKSVDGSLKKILKKIFARKKKSAEPEAKEEFEADPPKMSEKPLSTNTRSLASIDDFLDTKTDLENDLEDVPAEYLDFMSVGLEVSSSDLLEKHDKKTPSQKEQE